MRDWRRGLYDCMGGIADMAGANYATPLNLTSDTSSPAEPEPAPEPGPSNGVRTWNDSGMSQKRKKLLAVIGNQFPQLYWSGDHAAEFAPPIHGGGKYAQMTAWTPAAGGTSCTSINASIGFLLGAKNTKWAFAAYEYKDVWVPWGSDPDRKMPKVGDIYLLFRDKIKNPQGSGTDLPHLRHCGFILHVPTAPGEPWITADGGQNGGATMAQAAFLNRRPWELRKAGAEPKDKWEQIMEIANFAFAKPDPEIDYPYLAGGAESDSPADGNRLIGWLDMDSPLITFKSEAFDPPQAKLRAFNKFTEADYLDLGRRIDELLALQ